MATHINIPLKHYRAELFMEIKNFDQFNWWILFPLRILLYSALVVYIYELWSKIVWLGFVCCFRNKLTTLIKFGMGFYFVDFNPEWILLLLQYIGIIISHIFLVSVWNVRFLKDEKSVIDNCFLFLFRVISNLRGVTIILWQLSKEKCAITTLNR